MNIQPKYNMEIAKVIKSFISSAKVFLTENKNFEFRFKIIRVNKERGIYESKLSPRLKLKEDVMDFSNTKTVTFSDMDTENDVVELFPLIGSKEVTIKFESTKKKVKEIISNAKFEETWKLTEPEKSFVKLRVSFLLPETNIPSNINVINDNKSDNTNISKGPFRNIKNQFQTYKNQTKLSVNINRDNYLGSFSSFFSKEEISTPNNKNMNSINLDSDYYRSTTSTTFSEDGKIKNYLKLFEQRNSPTKDSISLKKQISYKDNIEVEKSSSPFIIKHTSSDLMNKFERKTVANSKEITRNIQSKNLFIPNSQDNLKILGYDELLYKDDDETNESFAEAFFGVSILENPKTIPGSERIGAPCQHKSCGSFSSYKPEIIFKVPKLNKKFELNSTIASLCFPKGIKLCYSPNDQEIKPMKNFMVVNTNAYGDKFYIMTYQYFIRYSLAEFQNKYKVHPVKDYLNIEKENADLQFYSNNEMMKKKITENIERKLEMCSDFLFNDYIYLPMTICLLSKYPYSSQMEKCLEVIFKMSIDDRFSIEELNKNILHLIREIPIPPSNKRLMFYIPYMTSPLEIVGPMFRDLPILNYNLKILFDNFSNENILLIHHLMLSEQKFLFIAENNFNLTVIIEGFLTLLYPLQWSYPYIPILSEELIKYLQTPLPFIMGIEFDLYEVAKEHLNEEDDVFLVYVDKNLVVPYSPKDKKVNMKQYFKEKHISPFPEQNEKEILQKLKEIKKVLTDNDISNINQYKLDKKIRKIFVNSMIKLFGDFLSHSSLVDGFPILNKESFLLNKSAKEKEFLDKLVDSQNFSNLMQLDTEFLTYFNKLLKKKEENSKSKEKFDVKSLLSDKKIEYLENFLISPYFINEDIIRSDITRIEEVLFEKFKENLSLDKTVNRITGSQKEFTKLGVYKKYKRYIIPELRQPIQKTIKSRIDQILHKQKTVEYEEKKFDTKTNIKKTVSLFDNKQKQNYENQITEYFRLILSSKYFSEMQKRNLMNVLKHNEAKKYFTNILFQSKFLEYKNHLLSDKSFSDLYSLIVFILLECNEESNKEDVILITKSLFFYYKDVNDKPYFFYEETEKKKGSFLIWTKVSFWEAFFEAEILEEMNRNKSVSKKETTYLKVLISMTKTMKDLNIEFSFISNFILEMGKKRILDKSMMKSLEEKIKLQLRE